MICNVLYSTQEKKGAIYMPRGTHSLYAIWGVLLLSASLVSCSLPARVQVSGASSDPPPISSPKPSLDAPASGKIVKSDSEQLPSVTPAITPSLPTDKTTSSAPAVEVSTIQPIPTKEALPAEASSTFQPEFPSLGGIKLGASDKDVFAKYGLPIDTYPLPGDKQSIEIWEYKGISIGINTKNAVVYVEITSSDVNTGIKGLSNGMKGTEAGLLLGVPEGDLTNVLTLEVTGGWFKLDLDPDTQKVLSMKLLSKEI
jgi:hypothetical protein